MFRDLLLLPDLAGHLAPRLSREDLAPVIDGRAEFLLLDVDIASLRKKLEDEWNRHSPNVESALGKGSLPSRATRGAILSK